MRCPVGSRGRISVGRVVFILGIMFVLCVVVIGFSMACYHPWRKDGDRQLLPCGQCRGCRAAKSREWSMRCMHEAAMHKDNVFFTGTVDDDHLGNGSLDRELFGSFMKRLRRRIEPAKVRSFYVGEYGSRTNRPHYHALLFGFDPSDKSLLSVRHGFPVYTSEMLSQLWSVGLHELGSVTSQSASYVAKYVRKTLTGNYAKAAYGDRVPPFALMSRNPGIGAGWIDKFGKEVYREDSVIMAGSECKPPRYYDDRVAKSRPELLEEIKWNRERSRNWEEERAERLHARDVVQEARESLEYGGSI